MDENDIIIILTDRLNGLYAEHKGEFTVVYDDLDAELQIDAGATKKHLDAAATHANLEIVRRGETRATLNRCSDKV